MSDSYESRGRSIEIRAADGGAFAGYLSLPPAGSGPGLVILQEIFGVNEHIRAVADRYAEEGYVVLAPDLFWRLKPGLELGFTPDQVRTAREYGQRFDTDQGVKDIGAAIETLRAHPACKGKVGAIGYCMGGQEHRSPPFRRSNSRSGISAAHS